jgi:predicted Na+-dependent transporter
MENNLMIHLITIVSILTIIGIIILIPFLVGIVLNKIIGARDERNTQTWFFGFVILSLITLTLSCLTPVYIDIYQFYSKQ